MATNMTTLAVKSRRNQNRGGRVARGGRNTASAAAAAGDQYFAPERAWLDQRGPQIARLAQQVKMVTALVNAEKRFYDVSGNCNPVINPTFQNLNGIPEGDDTQSRAGRSIRAKEIAVQLNFYSGASATNSQVVRVLIVKDNNPQGTVPTLANIMQSVSVNGMPVLDNYQGRFKWLFDETFTIGTLAGGNDAKVMKIDLKLDHHINFIGTTGASVGQGTLWLVVFCDSVSGNSSTGAYQSRLRYYDN